MSGRDYRIAIQHIRIGWTKHERGPEQGAARNAIPRDAPFRAPGASEKGWYQLLRYDAAEDYRRDERWDDLATVETWRLPVAWRLDGDHLWIGLKVFPLKRRWLQSNRWIVRLPFGQRCVIRLNDKWDGDHQRIYDENHIAVGFAAEASLDLPLFREIDERVLLY